ncbi:MAG: rod shape-determining protein MreC [Candidatus Uhrbacteria bacterium]
MSIVRTIRRFFIVVALVVLAVVVGRLSREPISGAGVGAALQRPLVTSATALRAWATAIFGAARTPELLRSLAEENATLRTRVAELDLEVRREDEPLGVPASVLAGLFRVGAQEVLIDRGVEDGVVSGAAAVYRGSLVGIVRTASPHRAIVRLITDPRTRIAVSLAGTGGAIGALGVDSGGGLIVSNVPYDRTDVVVGVTIVTDVTNDGLPIGLPIGALSDVRPNADGFTRRATVIPLVDPRTIAAVTVVSTSER